VEHSQTRQAWTERCVYWQKRSDPKSGRFVKRAGVREPLILSGHGVRLRVERGSLSVQNGFTHYPQKQEAWRFFPGDWRLPSRIVVLDVDGSLSFDALSWLARHDVPLVHINWRGEVTAALGIGHAINPECVAAQLEAQRNGKALPFAISLIREKIRNSIETLTGAVLCSPARDSAIKKLHLELTQLDKHPPRSIGALLGVEGRAAFAYFNAWQLLPLRWKGTGRHPIPDDWHRIGQRQSFVPKKPKNNNASHPVNAILNYAYAVLESQVRIQIVASGYDPTIGLLHSGRVGRGRHDFVFDLIEPLRPIVDRKVLEFVRARTFHPGDFTIRPDGACRLNPEMARNIVLLTAKSNETAIAIQRDFCTMSPNVFVLSGSAGA
jgi:CRISP-associated protein Cas1